MGQPRAASPRELVLMLMLAVQCSAVSAAGIEATVDATLPCAEWLSLRASGNAAAAQLWLSGALLTLATAEGIDVQSKDPSIYERWMDDYCRAERRSTLGQGLTRLLDELKRQRQRSAIDHSLRGAAGGAPPGIARLGVGGGR